MVIFQWNKNIITLLQFTFFVIVQTQIPDMTKLFCSQGFRLRGTNREELLAIRVLVVALV